MRSCAPMRQFGFINWVDNVNWTPKRDSKFTLSTQLIKPNFCLVIPPTDVAPKFLYTLTPFIHLCPNESIPPVTFLFPFPSLAIATPQLGYKYTLKDYTDKKVIGESTALLSVSKCWTCSILNVNYFHVPCIICDNLL